jgi:hypothetical protein
VPAAVRAVHTYQGAYRVLEHVGPWSSELAEQYRSSGCDGLRWQHRRRPTARPLDVSVLTGLTGLRYLSSSVRDADDSVVESLVELEWLDLLTRSKQPVDLAALTRLTSAALDDRPGLTGFPASLRQASLALSGRPDLSWLSGLTNLQAVKVEGMGQRVTLTGLGRLDHLTALVVDEALVETAEALALPALERAQFTASEPGDSTFDGAVLAGCESLRWVTVRGPGTVINVDAVLALPRLERCAIIGRDKPPADDPRLRYVEWSGGRGR